MESVAVAAAPPPVEALSLQKGWREMWLLTRHFPGYLPPADKIAVREWVVLAMDTPLFPTAPAEVDPESSKDAPFQLTQSRAAADVAKSTAVLPGSEAASSGHDASSTSLASGRVVLGAVSDGANPAAAYKLPAVVARGGSDGSFSASQLPSPSVVATVPLTFVMLNLTEVSPPAWRHLLDFLDGKRCLFLCSRLHAECRCPRGHAYSTSAIQQGVLSSFGITKMPVVWHTVTRTVEVSDIIPTAGFYFACGLLHREIVPAFVPMLCRYNQECTYGSQCLYIHTTVPLICWKRLYKAATNLEEYLRDYDERFEFAAFLKKYDLSCVGDVQSLSPAAFNALVEYNRGGFHSRVWLSLALLRDIRPKMNLDEVLQMFPIKEVFSLPPCLTTVSSLIHMPSKEFYQLLMKPCVLRACEEIRERFLPKRNYNVLDLRHESPDSFLLMVTSVVTQFREHHAHVSWRKYDPKRPVVTSLITYVESCTCYVDPEGTTETADLVSTSVSAILRKRDASKVSPRSPSGPPAVRGEGEPDSPTVPSPRDGAAPTTYPRGSWCKCPRKWEIAVNYELSTPSGSRCSEQNCLGKLAALGTPTYFVREVFVHGDNPAKDPNPLFPCGVCENMLRKIAKDVHERHGYDVALYMFDSIARPKRLVVLPMMEISHRDGVNFKRFVDEDVRD